MNDVDTIGDCPTGDMQPVGMESHRHAGCSENNQCKLIWMANWWKENVVVCSCQTHFDHSHILFITSLDRYAHAQVAMCELSRQDYINQLGLSTTENGCTW